MWFFPCHPDQRMLDEEALLLGTKAEGGSYCGREKLSAKSRAGPHDV